MKIEKVLLITFVSIFILVVLVLSLFAIGFYLDNNKEDKIDFGGIKIGSTNLRDLVEQVEEDKPFIICSIKDNKCVASMKKRIK